MSHKKHDMSSNLLWTTDGKNGKDDPNHSERWMATWLSLPGDLVKVQGQQPKDQKGETKDQQCEKLAAAMAAAGLKGVWSAKQVRDKLDGSTERCNL